MGIFFDRADRRCTEMFGGICLVSLRSSKFCIGTDSNAKNNIMNVIKDVARQVGRKRLLQKGVVIPGTSPVLDLETTTYTTTLSDAMSDW